MGVKISGITITGFKILKPTKPYLEMDDYGETRRFGVFATVSGMERKFTVYEFLDENRENICYVVSSRSIRLNTTKNKDFYYDDMGVFFPAWGISWKMDRKHKFDEDEVRRISEITGFRYVRDKKKKRFKVYVNRNREQLLTGSRFNEELARKLILGWLSCWELI